MPQYKGRYRTQDRPALGNLLVLEAGGVELEPGGRVNCIFLDRSVREVGLKELWTPRRRPAPELARVDEEIQELLRALNRTSP